MNMVGPHRLWRIPVLVPLALLFSAAAAAQPAPAVPPPPPAAAAAVPDAAAPAQGVTKVLSFKDLGLYGPAQLRGVEGIMGLPLGVRLDQVVTAAKLRLRLTYSPSMLPELSHIRVQLNGQVLAAIPLPKEEAGREVVREVVLDPRYFTDYNQLRFDLIGHYSLECEDAQHSSLWASISDHSELELTTAPLDLKPDLALLPAPFFDRRDNRRLELPVVLPAGASLDMIRSAGVLASWFGALADYRSARFPVSLDRLPERHALLLATNRQQPKGLAPTVFKQPTLAVIDHPADRNIKLLLVAGADDAQLRQAAEALVLGQAVLSGPWANVTKVEPGPRRAAYDAPRWLRTDRPVKLGELVESLDQLQVSGHAPAPIRVNLRIPPDLLTWNRPGVPIDLRYRYTAPAERDNSLLSVAINNQLVKAFRLAPDQTSGSASELLVPLLADQSIQDKGGFLIPAFQIGANNQMQFQFAIEYHKRGLCSGTFTDITRAAIDPESSIDLTPFPHYTAMPNLALFANAGYPFTKFADLAETAVVLPAAAGAKDYEALFFLLGRMGRSTGVAALRYRLAAAADAAKLGDVDLLLIGGGAKDDLLERWGHDLGLLLQPGSRQFLSPQFAGLFQDDPLRRGDLPRRESELGFVTQGPLGAVIGFESPLKKGRSVVAISATDPAAAGTVLDTLEDEGKVPHVRGDLAVVRGGEVRSYQGEPVYYVGDLSWWMRLWFHLSRYPLLLTVLGVIAGVLLALWLYATLRRAATARLED